MATGLAVLVSHPAFGQEIEEPLRTRVAAGVQVVPSYPGAHSVSIRPLFDLSRERGDRSFVFSAPDQSFGFSILQTGGLAVGPAIGFEGSRTGDDVGADLPKVGSTIEAGAFVQYAFSDGLRVRAELRQGLGGHEGLIASVGADWVARQGDEWLFSVGPRVAVADGNYHDAYFSVAREDSAPSGLPAYSADGGILSAGLAASFLHQLTPRWGLYSYTKYDRLLGDAADSPVVQQYGSSDQLSGGLALTYTFGGNQQRTRVQGTP